MLTQGSNQRAIRNRVILATRPQAQEFLLANSELRPLTAGQVLYADGQPFTHAVLPHDGIVSLMAGLHRTGPAGRARERTVEKASIGNEGFLGFNYLMGGGAALGDALVTVDGYASWLSLEALTIALARFECVRETMLRYAKALIVQLMESVACNSLHTAEQRISRWLLMANDRMANGAFAITQQTMARTLGLRRATVSTVCSDLMQAGVITYTRGRVSVLRHDFLERYGCECYHRTRLAQF